MSNSNRNILVLTDTPFWDVGTGSAQRVSKLLQFLKNSGYSIEVQYMGYPKIVPENISDILPFKFHYVKDLSFFQNEKNRFKSSKKLRLLSKATIFASRVVTFIYYKYLRRLLIRPPFSTDKHLERLNIVLFRDICKSLNPSILLIEYLRLSYILGGLDVDDPNKPTTFVDTHDVLSCRYSRFQSVGLKSAVKISPELESFYLNRFDVIIAIQKKEEEQLRSLAPDKKIILCPHVDDIHEAEFRNSRPVIVGFIGTSNESNLSAIRRFLEVNWRIITGKLQPNTKLIICGDVCQAIDLQEFKYQNVELMGRIANLNEFYCKVDICINPVEIGSGLKIKNIEALCHAKALLTSSCGAEGLEDGINQAFWVRDQVEDQITALIELINCADTRFDLGRKAAIFASNRFVPKYAFADLVDEIENSFSHHSKSFMS